MPERPTLLRQPPPDPNKAPIENVLDVTELAVLGPNIFTNTRKPWHPPGARGIYGGSVIAMCISAAQRTLSDDFMCHSCHCYFLLAGSSELPILFHVENVRDGRSFATRTVQAKQKGRVIFTTTISFVRENSSSSSASVAHAAPMPLVDAAGNPLRPPPDDFNGEPELLNQGPFQGHRIEVLNKDSALAHEKKTRQWVRARGKIAGGHQAHLTALAYVSDSYFIGTITRIHQLWRFPFRPEEIPQMPAETQERVRLMHDWEGLGSADDMKDRPEVSMMVSLDHTIYFHEPKRVVADEWMLNEMESPWAGDGRGVVTQRIFSKDGTLLATCVQEGVVRVKEVAKVEGKESKL
ncbi:acyl-coenzyme A thioesterase 8 [Podospora conica]|nr:acyl-coenzyme A thioesterase 8 [Schizothecium conicum]